MKLYDCTIRLGGSLVNEVYKTDVTPAEIAVLKALHGSDAVQKIVPSVDAKGKPKVVKRTGAEERARLHAVYASENSLTAEDARKKRAMMTELFGHDSLPLPEEMVDVKVEEPAEDFAA